MDLDQCNINISCQQRISSGVSDRKTRRELDPSLPRSTRHANAHENIVHSNMLPEGGTTGTMLFPVDYQRPSRGSVPREPLGI